MLKRHMRGNRPTMAALKGRKESPVATIGLEAFMARAAVRRAIDYIDKTAGLPPEKIHERGEVTVAA
jgi:hypothetical protein